MKAPARILTLLLSLLGAPVVSFAAPPAHDSITKAIPLTDNYATQDELDLSLATAAKLDPLLGGGSAGKSVWYVLPAQPLTSLLEVSVKSVTATGHLGLFEILDPENPAGSLQFVSQAAITTGDTTTLEGLVPSSVRMAIMVAGKGSFTLSHRLCEQNTAHDFPSKAITLTGLRGTTTGNNYYATATRDEPLAVGSLPKTNTVWYKWTTPFTGAAYVDTNFSYLSGNPKYVAADGVSPHGTVLAVHAGTASGPVAHLVSDNVSGWGFNSLVSFQAVAGQTYYIAVGTTPNHPSGPFNLNYYAGGSAGEIYLMGVDHGSSLEAEVDHPIYVRRRYADPNAACGCWFSPNDSGSAKGADLWMIAMAVNFTSGLEDSSWENEVHVTLKDDDLAEPPTELAQFTLYSPNNGATLGTAAGYFLIIDDEALNSGVHIPSDEVRVAEGDIMGRVQIQRYGPEASFYELTCAAGEGTAEPFQDFLPGSVLMSTVEASKELKILLVDDAVFEAEEQVTIHVAHAGQFTLVIEDDDPYVPVPGNLVSAVDYAHGARQAMIAATISPLGTISGKLLLPGQAVPFSGKLDSRGKLIVPIAPKGRPIFMLTMAAQNQSGDFKITLLDARTMEAAWQAVRVRKYHPKNNPCPQAGSYTVTTGGSGDVLQHCAANVKVSASGGATLTGRMFDNTPFTLAGLVDGQGVLCANAAMYGSGNLGFRGELPAFSGQAVFLAVKVNRPARANDPLKLGALAGHVLGYTARYSPPAPGKQALEAWYSGIGKAQLNGGPLAVNLTKFLGISNTNIITTPADAEKLKLTLMPKTGLFSGSFIPPGKTKALPIFGALLDLPGTIGSGSGFFFDGVKGGYIAIGKP